MKYKIIILLISALFSAETYAQTNKQEKYTKKTEYAGEKETLPVCVKYKIQENKSGNKEVKVKFINKAKSDVNVDIELAFYLNGVLEEKAQINDCLKRFFWNDWFRPYHLISSETLTKEQLNDEALEIQITEFKLQKVDECRETDS